MQTLRFEDQVAMLYSQRGNRIEREVKRSEGISDLFLLSSKGEKWIVRCVNLDEVDSSIAHDFIQVMQSEKAQQGSIITRGIINVPVAQLVKGKPIHLVDGKKLQDYLDRLPPQPQHSTPTTQPTLKRFVEAKSGTTEKPSPPATPLRPHSDQTPMAVAAPNLSTSESAASSLKPCPYCAEMIQEAAIVCRFCGRDLEIGAVPHVAPVQAIDTASADEQRGCSPLAIIVLIGILLTIIVGAGLGSTPSNSGNRSSTSSQPRQGWLCDFDKTASIRLWTAASLDATVKDAVGTCLGCCVDVTMYEETLVEGILFYRISVGSQSGWVDVDYFYWNKPGWSTN